MRSSVVCTDDAAATDGGEWAADGSERWRADSLVLFLHVRTAASHIKRMQSEWSELK